MLCAQMQEAKQPVEMWTWWKIGSVKRMYPKCPEHVANGSLHVAHIADFSVVPRRRSKGPWSAARRIGGNPGAVGMCAYISSRWTSTTAIFMISSPEWIPKSILKFILDSHSHNIRRKQSPIDFLRRKLIINKQLFVEVSSCLWLRHSFSTCVHFWFYFAQTIVFRVIRPKIWPGDENVKQNGFIVLRAASTAAVYHFRKQYSNLFCSQCIMRRGGSIEDLWIHSIQE